MPLNTLDIDLYESEDPIWNPAMMAIPVPGIRKMVNMAASMEDVIHLSIGQPDLRRSKPCGPVRPDTPWMLACRNCLIRLRRITATDINVRCRRTI
jgi:hypothetical protein